jgi:hypothetical protein
VTSLWCTQPCRASRRATPTLLSQTYRTRQHSSRWGCLIKLIALQAATRTPWQRRHTVCPAAGSIAVCVACLLFVRQPQSCASLSRQAVSVPVVAVRPIQPKPSRLCPPETPQHTAFGPFASPGCKYGVNTLQPESKAFLSMFPAPASAHYATLALCPLRIVTNTP